MYLGQINLKNLFASSGDEIIKRMNGSDITKEYFHQHGFTVPILVEKKEGLGMILPPPSFSVEDVEKKVGKLDLRVTSFHYVQF